jgi:ribonuclease PH
MRQVNFQCSTFVLHSSSPVLEAVLVTESHQQTAISLALHIVQDDGALLAACINCTALCLLDAAIALKGVVTAAESSFTSIASSQETLLIVDPRSEEERRSAATCCVAATECGATMDCTESQSVVLLSAQGALSSLEALMAENLRACAIVREKLVAVVTEKLQRVGIGTQD